MKDKRQKKDKDVIDVSNEWFVLNPKGKYPQLKDNFIVPFWKNKIIVSPAEIKDLSSEQLQFYIHFKTCFLRGEYLDLQGFRNYAMLLYHDLYELAYICKTYKSLYNDLDILFEKYNFNEETFIENALKSIKTNDNQLAFDLFSEENDNIDANKPNTQNHFILSFGTGWKFQNLLHLNEEEVTSLNYLTKMKLSAFTEIQFCYQEVLKIHVKLLRKLKDSLNKKGLAFDKILFDIAFELVNFEYGKIFDRQQYDKKIDEKISELHSNIFKYSENLVREHYHHTKKLDTIFACKLPKVIEKYDTIISLISRILPPLAKTIKKPGKEVELELNRMNPLRWKIYEANLAKRYANNPEEYFKKLVNLGNTNYFNYSFVEAPYKAASLVAEYNTEIALKLYLYYIAVGYNWRKFVPKALPEQVHNKIFISTDFQLKYDKIIRIFIKKDNFNQALNDISALFVSNRKKIEIDKSKIQKIAANHNETVELLGQYLEDDNIDNDDNQGNTISITKKDNQNIDNSTKKTSVSKYQISLEAKQIETIDLFVANEFKISTKDFETFAKNNNLFKNQLIDSINEDCFETLDDVLIEEIDNCYTMDKDYYQTLLKK